MSNTNNNNTSQKKPKRSAAAMARRAARWATQKAAKKASALANRNTRKAEQARRQETVLQMFPDVMGIVGAQGFMPNVRKSMMTSKTMKNALGKVSLFQNANHGTVYPGGKTVLGHFLENGKWADAMALLEKGVPKKILDQPSSYGETPLMVTYTYNQLAVFKKLLDKGANPNLIIPSLNFKFPIISKIITSYETTPHKLPFIDELIKHKANINLMSSTHLTPLMYSMTKRVSDNENQIGKLLIDNGALVESPNPGGFTAVLSAIAEKNKGILEYMIEKKEIDLDKKTGKNGLFPLKIAVVNSSYEILEFILNNGVKSIDEKDTEGNTALHYAVLAKDFRKIALLKEKGAKSNIANKKGVTALQLAQALDTAGNSRAYNILK